MEKSKWTLQMWLEGWILDKGWGGGVGKSLLGQKLVLLSHKSECPFRIFCISRLNSSCVSFLFHLLWKLWFFTMYHEVAAMKMKHLSNQAVQKWVISPSTFWHPTYSDVLGFNLILHFVFIFVTEQVILLTNILKAQTYFLFTVPQLLFSQLQISQLSPDLAFCCSFIRAFIAYYCLESQAKSWFLVIIS